MGKYTFILLCAVIAAFLLGRCSRTPERTTTTVKEVEFVHHHDTVYSVIPVPKLFFHPVPADVDTAAILAAYYTEKHYRDTIVLPYFSAVVSDVIQRNQLVERVVTVGYREPVIKRRSLVVSSMLGTHNCALLAGIRNRTWTCQIGYDMHNRSLMFGVTKEVVRW